MIVRAKRVLHHSSQLLPPWTDHYGILNEGGKRAPLGAGVYALKASSTKASATNVGELYAVVVKSKKEAKKKEEDRSTVTNKDELYTVPVKKDKMTDEGMGASGGAEKSEDYDQE